MLMRRFIVAGLAFLLIFTCLLPCYAAQMEPDDSTPAVDCSTSLPDGRYQPEQFSFSGGTGKVKITCSGITVKDGISYADIRFSSSSYTYVKASGMISYAEIIDGKAAFLIPIALNQNNSILALTTKMSTPHEIEYTLFASLSANENVCGDQLDDAAPEIASFTICGESESTKQLRLFRYNKGILAEIDTQRDSETGAGLPDEEQTAADCIAELYRKRVLKYLIIDADTDIPAGLEKQYIIIRTPVKRVCVVGENRSVPEEKCVSAPLSLENPDYKALLLNKVQLIWADNQILDALSGKLADRLAALNIVPFVDLSAAEETPEEQAVWARLTDILFC